MPPEKPWQVPANYFPELAKRISLRTHHFSSLPFQLPEKYFEVLPDSILKRTEALPKSLPFTVEEDYFTQLNVCLLASKSKVVPEISPRQEWAWLGMAAALALVVTLLQGLMVEKPDAAPSSQEILASLDREELIRYLEQHGSPEQHVIYDLAEEKEISLPGFGDAKPLEAEKELWKDELELENLDELELE